MQRDNLGHKNKLQQPFNFSLLLMLGMLGFIVREALPSLYCLSYEPPIRVFSWILLEHFSLPREGLSSSLCSILHVSTSFTSIEHPRVLSPTSTVIAPKLVGRSPPEPPPSTGVWNDILFSDLIVVAITNLCLLSTKNLDSIFGMNLANFKITYSRFVFAEVKKMICN
ncbi:unnamed protein product [Trifolium pratense]|uniref:Uncharacterized protein n=1 Tax=Trifolium pratense TaxID=57577 RepID=A0ACB0I8L3_TRIPR|nr:unnamed protein product [Trifolium pratense]